MTPPPASGISASSIGEAIGWAIYGSAAARGTNDTLRFTRSPARSRVEARLQGLRLVNGYRVHDYEWSQVLSVTLKPGSPWAVMDLSDGTSVSAIGIQGSDGPRAVRQVKQLRALVEENSRTERDD